MGLIGIKTSWHDNCLYTGKERHMKKILVFVMASCFTAAVFASGGIESVKAEGTIRVIDGIPVIQSGEKSWMLPPGAFYRLAWENGVKEGDSVRVEGISRDMGARMGRGSTLAEEKGYEFLMPSRVWVNGKELSLESLDFPRGVCGGAGFAGRADNGYGRNRFDRDDQTGRGAPRGGNRR